MRERHYIIIAAVLAAIIAVISAVGAFTLNTSKMGEKISSSLQLKDNYLKKYAYPEVRSNIFLAFAAPVAPAPKPVVIEQKKDLPPPVDPYEQYYRDLKTYQIFGFSKDGENNMVFLSRGDSTLTLKKGDTFGDKYIVNGLTDNEMTVGLVDDNNFQYKMTQR